MGLNCVFWDDSKEVGLWSARSAEIRQQDLMQDLRALRVIGDTIFALGGATLACSCLSSGTRWSIKRS